MNSQIDWTSEQWDQIQQVVADEVSKASVAGSFLSCCGPLEGSATVVRTQRLSDQPAPITVDDVSTLQLWTLAVQVELRQRQLAEEHLSGAVSAFRRAANLLARAEDAIVFNNVRPSQPSSPPVLNIPQGVPPQCSVSGGDNVNGLVAEGSRSLPTLTGGLVSDVAGAIATLEQNGHLGPFACILGQVAFVEANTPIPGSLVLPKDRIEPMLGTQLLRSSTLDSKQVVVVSLAGDPIDLVVATSPTVQFLNVSNEARYLFRVYEKFVLRVKEEGAVSAFSLP
ncbi:encapsulin [Acaryochloris sp. CCMEE 5410]|uniref:encapsulin n=1 Tax=Acaryochloris sp. CCMEE 5410 TaxID=310037 RepID=UPI0002484CE7|nr:encapsulin [Acaryochloris sp. CCMEE 5410]KAI9130783.1 encapsulin [Acaryochloris sp. CCMEE 5410]